MRASLSLPLPTRHVDVPLVPFINELETVVESVASSQPIIFSARPLSPDVALNRVIIEAQFNAEANRRMSMDNLDDVEADSPIHAHESGRAKSISFGNESELEYYEEEGVVPYRTTVRFSKDFDGNRSGRPSAKQ